MESLLLGNIINQCESISTDFLEQLNDKFKVSSDVQNFGFQNPQDTFLCKR